MNTVILDLNANSLGKIIINNIDFSDYISAIDFNSKAGDYNQIKLTLETTAIKANLKTDIILKEELATEYFELFKLLLNCFLSDPLFVDKLRELKQWYLYGKDSNK